MQGLKGKYYSCYTSLTTPTEARSKSTLNQVLSVQFLPSCIVVDAKTGRSVTRWGKSCVERNGDKCIQEWREGREGVTYVQALCTIS